MASSKMMSRNQRIRSISRKEKKTECISDIKINQYCSVSYKVADNKSHLNNMILFPTTFHTCRALSTLFHPWFHLPTSWYAHEELHSRDTTG
mmetsp:Transcript_4226/g.10755  ORF Transcript_4226/g.10755 Transcript_4226/m.10755 type:complete len:92 (-) Transcript_4226:78-353(-)